MVFGGEGVIWREWGREKQQEEEKEEGKIGGGGLPLWCFCGAGMKPVKPGDHRQNHPSQQ